MTNSVIVGCLLLATLYKCGQLPEGFKRCKQRDNECLGEAIKDAFTKLTQDYSEVGLPSLNPMEIHKFWSKNDGERVITDLAQNYSNLEIYGLTEPCSVKAQMNFTSLRGEIEIAFPKLHIKGHFVAEGFVLFMLIDGEGEGKLTLENFKVKFSSKFAKFDRGGVTYLKVAQSTMTFDTDDMIFDFENLVAGFPDVSATANRMLNGQWINIFSDVKENYAKAVNIVAVKIINRVLGHLPFDELFLN